ncbi:MAG: FRG domain-containing protein [Phycisphaerales bacterium]
MAPAPETNDAGWRTFRPESVPELLSTLTQLSTADTAVYRGSPRQYRPVTAALDRTFDWANYKTTDGEPIAPEVLEAALLRRFQQIYEPTALPHELPKLHTALGIMSIMQHYGAPTRFLDWTESIWIASYFACREEPSLAGEVFAVSRAATEKAMPKLADICRKKCRDVTIVDWGRHLQDYSLSSSPAVFFVEPLLHFDRTLAQLGVFSMATLIGADHMQLLGQILSKDQKSFAKIEILPNLKRELLTYLYAMNVRASRLFPGREGLGREQAEVVKHRLGSLAWNED